MSAIEQVAQVLNTITPVFGLILIGYTATLCNWIDRGAGPAIAQFIFSFAIPALIFRTIVMADLAQLDPAPVAAVFLGAVAFVWVLSSLFARLAVGLRGPAVASFSFAVGFSNVLILGLPVSLNAFGPAALPPLLVVVALDVPFMWLVATVQAGLASRSAEASLHKTLWTLLKSLARNPIILATFAGILWRWSETPMPEVGQRFIDLLGKAALPGALFALGATLTTFSLRGAIPALLAISVLKLAVLPAVVWGIAAHVFVLPPLQVAVLTLAAASPTGVNAYLFAARYDAIPGTVAGAIAMTTALSVITMSIVLVMVGTQ